MLNTECCVYQQQDKGCDLFEEYFTVFTIMAETNSRNYNQIAILKLEILNTSCVHTLYVYSGETSLSHI